MPYFILAKGSPHEGGNMINKVLAIILYISGLFDSKSIVKEVVLRKKQNKGGGRLLIQGGDYIYIYIYIYVYIYIYIHIYIHTYIHIRLRSAQKGFPLGIIRQHSGISRMRCFTFRRTPFEIIRESSGLRIFVFLFRIGAPQQHC